MTQNSGIHIFGGGTLSHVRAHFALTAAAYGETARALQKLLAENGIAAEMHLTRMACMGQSDLETNADVRRCANDVLADANSKVIIFNVAITDFDGQIGDVPSGKHAPRLKSRDKNHAPVSITPADKIVPALKAARPDIFLVAFKTTAGADRDDQIERGTKLLNDTQADLVLANDTATRRNILLGKGGIILCDTQDRAIVLKMIATHVTAIVPPPPPVRKKPDDPKNLH